MPDFPARPVTGLIHVIMNVFITLVSAACDCAPPYPSCNGNCSILPKVSSLFLTHIWGFSIPFQWDLCTLDPFIVCLPPKPKDSFMAVTFSLQVAKNKKIYWFWFFIPRFQISMSEELSGLPLRLDQTLMHVLWVSKWPTILDTVHKWIKSSI